MATPADTGGVDFIQKTNTLGQHMTTADTTSIAPKAQTHNPADNTTLASNAADTTNVKADKKADALKTPAHRDQTDVRFDVGRVSSI